MIKLLLRPPLGEPLIARKSCCGGSHARLVRRLRTMEQTIEGKTNLWNRGLYHCGRCGKYTIRGEWVYPARLGMYVEPISKARGERLRRG